MLIVVQCVEQRRHLRGTFPDGCEFVEDDGRGARHTFVRCVSRSQELIYLQDDAVCCPKFLATLASRDLGRFDIVMLFCNRKAVNHCQSSEELIAVPRSYLTMAVGLYLSRRVCDAVEAWELQWSERNPQHRAAIDYMLRDLLMHNKWSLGATVPSLVQHRDADSHLGHPCGRRQSESYRRAFGDVDLI
uniref:Uncharacterized protein n=1 Tax=Rubinisphaera brasiliensis (strain ATCC 49424 / DSM 5305 / JCM 21570 / IAM 15109 / NBRC 103401 / IFAM 1448) TaxID=756272 RepID=F0SPH2_RUBBR|nr:hypothetical protein Plabr_0247 [Rubinisphaera brasiliensis DSM 5305]